MSKLHLVEAQPDEWMGLSRGGLFQQLQLANLIEVKHKPSPSSYLIHVAPSDLSAVLETMKKSEMNPQERVLYKAFAALVN
jgi:hypothetical protein